MRNFKAPGRYLTLLSAGAAVGQNCFYTGSAEHIAYFIAGLGIVGHCRQCVLLHVWHCDNVYYISGTVIGVCCISGTVIGVCCISGTVVSACCFLKNTPMLIIPLSTMVLLRELGSHSEILYIVSEVESFTHMSAT